MSRKRRNQRAIGAAAIALALSCTLLPGCEKQPVNAGKNTLPTASPFASTSTTSPVMVPTLPSMPEPTQPNQQLLPQKGQVIAIESIEEAAPFSQGLAFVRLAALDGYVCCINTRGEVEILLEGNYHQIHGFCNGYALLMKTNKVYLCDTQGNLQEPEDFGGTQFLMEGNLPTTLDLEMFRDGYLSIRRKSAGDGQWEIGVYDLKNKKFIYPYSAEPYDAEGGLRWMGGNYFDGCIYRITALGIGEDYFDLRDGQFKGGFKDLSMEETPQYAATFWEARLSGIVDARKSKRRHPPVIVMELPDWDAADTQIYESMMLAFRTTEDTQGTVKRYCAVLDLQGNVLLDAFEVTDMQLICDGEYILAYNENGLLRVYSRAGLVAEKTVSMGKQPMITIQDGIIMLLVQEKTGVEYCFLKANLEPLF